MTNKERKARRYLPSQCKGRKVMFAFTADGKTVQYAETFDEAKNLKIGKSVVRTVFK